MTSHQYSVKGLWPENKYCQYRRVHCPIFNDVNTLSILFASALWESVCVSRDQRKASLEIVNNMARHEPGES